MVHVQQRLGGDRCQARPGRLQRGEAYANAVTAIPSLHSAVPVMVLLFTWSLVRRRTRVLLVLYGLAMTFRLVYGSEHFVVDAFVGWAYAAIAVVGVAWWFRRAQTARADQLEDAPT